ncbi:hypothetical protein [Streptomyces profundus]|uniref:hypothetical protein n=1 Tax=Streptomyces profundus TaxID=2867410 RepID=UPI001D166CB4|nr:hypothetical protein [Streptomyces sp. MA3_2.13]UED88806.1 hypothetical protein K4G22_06630 [Streptomyces sp. MA3_2.13]
MTTTIPTASTPTNPEDQSPAATELSRHATSEGTVSWSRCACGRLRMALTPQAPAAPAAPAAPTASGPTLTAGARTPGCPLCD